ncbi:MAG: 30S ribosomal protein S2 [Actinomycetota bacterium]|jgi:small subunit ribosomal protein S2|nr:30S ribosomal protein S2 [Actinomycetota bacterium]
MAVVTMRQLLEAGVHFGHQTRRWNPKMKRFIFGERNGIYIIDLEQTLQRIDVAYSFVRDLVADGGSILFVGTKKQTQDPISTYAIRCDMPYVNERWLGGMLTNFNTIAGRVKKMQEYQRMRVAGDFEAMPKKEALILSRELDKLERNLGGIRGMNRLPEAIFVIDTKKEHIAVTEANKLGLPVVAVVDTNCDPDVIQYVIPGNDDAIRAGTLMCRVIADAVEEGRFIAARRAARSAGSAAGAPAAPPVVSAEEEARRAEQQREARRQAALQQQEREARLAETARRRDAGEADVPVPEAPAGRGSGADQVAEAAAPADQVAEAAAPADGAADTSAASTVPASAESRMAGSEPEEPSGVESPGPGAVADVEAATGAQVSADQPAD